MTPKQRRFVAEYAIDGNGTQAAIRAGYSPHTAKAIATENLSKPLISTQIEANQLAMIEKAAGSAEWIIEKAVEVVNRCLETGQMRPITPALALLAKRYPEFRDHSIVINNDNRQLTIEAERLATVLGIDAREILAEVEGK